MKRPLLLLLLLLPLLQQSSSNALLISGHYQITTTVFKVGNQMTNLAANPELSSKLLIRLSERSWRSSAAHHSQRIRNLLEPGLLASSSSPRRERRKQQNHQRIINNGNHCDSSWMPLDPQNPIYNFLIDYYGLKGTKGPRRLARWSPDPNLLLLNSNASNNDKNHNVHSVTEKTVADGILLEGADCNNDLGTVLHLRGAMPHPEGVVYSPAQFYGKGDPMASQQQQQRVIAPFLWYRSVLQNTLRAEPVLHCHGLHEWAMQYQPPGAPDPPSAKYQSHLPLRVSREVINQTVERKGIHCTHVDALRFFAPSARPLNHRGEHLERVDQLQLEQPACVHAHMDLIKMALKLQPFVSSELLANAVEIALLARTLDVAASPYDATAYGVVAVPIETTLGREQYRARQQQLMRRAQEVRRQLLRAYDTFLQLSFD